ncbi:MAG: Fic family protein [Alphaproteobacteria bacterium]|nr:Fic family protein [Alphaproteobacteria bacterium]
MIRIRGKNDTIGKMYNKRQELILDFVKDNPNANRDQIALFLEKMSIEASKVTIIRDLNTLIHDGLIEKSGNAKSTTYSSSLKMDLLAHIDVDQYFDTEEDFRKLRTKGFNFEIFPALKGLFSHKEKLELDELNSTFQKKKLSLTPKLLQKEFERLTVELAWKSSKIEGNTYTLLDTERLLKDHISAKGKSSDETNMVINHKKALDYVLNDPSYFKQLTISKIEDIHRILVENLGVSAGIREGTVGIIGTEYRPLDNAFQIRDALKNLIDVINQTRHPVEKALIAVMMISYIQPFEDGNKRTSRIIGNALLLAHDYCPMSYRSVDEIEYKKAIILFYEQNNASYFKQLFIDQFKQAVDKYF